MSAWLFVYEGFDPDGEGHREALCVLGNGYFATRGAAPECVADGVHYPGTYVAGVYNRLVTRIAGDDVPNESLVNVPNWLPLTFRVGDGSWFGAAGTEVLAHHVELDMFRGILTRRSRLRDPEGHVVQLTQRRFVSMRDPHLAGLETTLVAENFSGRLELHSALDGTVRNSGVERYASLADRHLEALGTDGVGDDIISLDVQTTQSHVRIAEAARTRVYREGRRLAVEHEHIEREGYIASQYAFDVEAGEETTVEKIVSLFTSRDTGISEPGEEARSRLARTAGDFDELLRRHAMSWRQLWARTRIELGTDGSLARVLHLHLFHLLQTVSNNTLGLDVGVPARGLHGEAYRGHIFWDELFILPFLSLRFPELAKALVLYRYRRLHQARLSAADAGFDGAMFPWQSGSSGREETQTMHLNPVSGRWLPDASHLQRHVNAAIVHNTWRYYQASSDVEFLRIFGAELILEIARFWASASTYDHTRDRYEIKGVMGPDEYHDGYPDRDEPGLDNNAYTNVMAVWCLGRAFDTLEALPGDAAQELRARLDITDDDLDRWTDITRKMRVCFHDGVISQFEGYELLAELDWDAYRNREGDVSRLDRILESEGDSPNRYQLAKQADVVMLFYVLSPGEVTELFSGLGYQCDRDMMRRTIDYYEARTAHGSTLSRVVHSWVHARHDRERSWHLFTAALYGDVDGVETSTTNEGIHLGAMAGTMDLIQRCYTGIETRRDMLTFDPVIPNDLGSLSFDVQYRGHLVHLTFTTTSARVHVDRDGGEPITIAIRDHVRVLEPGDTLEVELDVRRDA